MEKRRDSKGRILRTGESQRKDGRYAYKYINALGEPKFEYAWKLVPTDKTPAGKRDDISLREKEQAIQKDLNDGIDTVGKKMTVCQLYAKKNSHRKNIKRNTEKGRKYLMDILKKDPLGARSIDTVKQSDAKEWCIRMNENGYACIVSFIGSKKPSAVSWLPQQNYLPVCPDLLRMPCVPPPQPA